MSNDDLGQGRARISAADVLASVEAAQMLGVQRASLARVMRAYGVDPVAVKVGDRWGNGYRRGDVLAVRAERNGSARVAAAAVRARAGGIFTEPFRVTACDVE